jgi:hypothetical protein
MAREAGEGQRRNHRGDDYSDVDRGDNRKTLTMKPLPKIKPMELVQQATPFDHPDWLYEPKHDGFCVQT